MSGGIFISYRREDIRHAAKHLVDRLGQVYGPRQLFIGSDAIEPRPDFFEASGRKIESSAVLLALIGPDWLEARDPGGWRRLDDPSDFVRLEIETALRRNVHVVPILLDGAGLPAEESLPDSLKPLTRNGAVTLTHERFAADADGLVRALAEAIPPQREPAVVGRPPPPRPERASAPRPAGFRLMEWVHLPSVTLAALGLASGILGALWGVGPSAYSLPPKFQWLEPLGSVFPGMNTDYIPIGFFFAAAMALGVWFWTRNSWALLVVPVVTMYAWSIAVSVAVFLQQFLNAETAGPVAGAIGAGMTHLGCGFVSPALRRPKWIVLSCAVGALAGTVYVMAHWKMIDELLLYVVWQPVVAFCLGMGLGRARSEDSGLPLATFAYVLLSLPVSGVLFFHLTSGLNNLLEDPLPKEIAGGLTVLLAAGIGVYLRRWNGLATARSEVVACWLGGILPIALVLLGLSFLVDRWKFLGSARGAPLAGAALAALALMFFDLYRHRRARTGASRRPR